MFCLSTSTELVHCQVRLHILLQQSILLHLRVRVTALGLRSFREQNLAQQIHLPICGIQRARIHNTEDS